jgi:prepilin-type N-terminal cleavage/methylation domain-containing protein
MKNLDKYAFTLIELLVVITLIVIITVWWMNLNFNTLNDSQNLNIFANKIITNFEEVRNNALLWKGVGTNLDIPKEWRIDFIRSWNGNIEVYYRTDIWNFYNKIPFSKDMKLISVECMNADESIKTNVISSWSILVENNSLHLWWECNDERYIKILLRISYKNTNEKFLEINRVNGLVQIKK